MYSAQSDTPPTPAANGGLVRRTSSNPFVLERPMSEKRPGGVALLLAYSFTAGGREVFSEGRQQVFCLTWRTLDSKGALGLVCSVNPAVSLWTQRLYVSAGDNEEVLRLWHSRFTVSKSNLAPISVSDPSDRAGNTHLPTLSAVIPPNSKVSLVRVEPASISAVNCYEAFVTIF